MAQAGFRWSVVVSVTEIGTAHGAEKFGSGELSKFHKESFGDAAQSRRQVCREGRPVRRRHADEAARPTEEIAPAFAFLAAPSRSSYITGEIVPIIGATPEAERDFGASLALLAYARGSASKHSRFGLARSAIVRGTAKSRVCRSRKP